MYVRKLPYNLGVLSNYAPRGRDSCSFLWKNIGPGYVEFANVLVQMPAGGSQGQLPGMAADKCITKRLEEARNPTRQSRRVFVVVAVHLCSTRVYDVSFTQCSKSLSIRIAW